MTYDAASYDFVLDELRAQEDELQLATFTNRDAWELGSLLVERGTAAGLPIAISIRRNHHDLFYAALDGAAQDNVEWLRRKCAVVDRWGHSSRYVGLTFEAKGQHFDTDARLDRDAYAAHGGAFPLIIRGVGPVGTVAVSGLPSVEDHNFVVAGLREFLAART